jgi:hypothetical protein
MAVNVWHCDDNTLSVIVGLDPTIHDTKLTIFLSRNLHIGLNRVLRKIYVETGAIIS